MMTKNSKESKEKNKLGKLEIYTDGGSRGNPGQSAIGVIIANKE